jgi:hypothetical protein
MMSYPKLIVAAIVVGFLAWTNILAYKFGADGVRLDVAKKALKQIERAQDETRTMKEKADAAQKTYQQAQADIALRDHRIRDLNVRMRNSPTAQQLANASAAACGEYAASVDRDFAECRAEYAALGTTAASASAAAWAHRDAWPTLNREAINRERETLRTTP